MRLRNLSRLTGYSRQKLGKLAKKGLININRLSDIGYVIRIIPLLKLRKSMNERNVRLKEAA